MAKFTVTLQGFKELEKRLKDAPKKLQNEVDAVLEDGAKAWVQKAKRDAPADLAALRSAIVYENIGKHSYEIQANKHYAPYVEFGTISKVSVPAGLESYAMQFKGKGIRTTGGITPVPYFFKQEAIVWPQVVSDIKVVLDSI